MKLIGVLLVMILVGGGFTAPSKPDWQFVGTYSYPMPGGQVSTFDFISRSDVRRLPANRVQVQIEGILDSDMNSMKLTPEENRRLIQRYVQGYRPPFATIRAEGKKDAVLYMMLEETADSGKFTPAVQIFSEFDCARKMARTLDAFIAGKPAKFKGTAWEPVGSKGDLAWTISKIVCKD